MRPHNRTPQRQGQRGQGEGEVFRVRIPRGREVLGVLEQRLGANRMLVKCLDGKSRVCRVPGRMKRRLWLREGDTILVEPWELQGDEKADILHKYGPTEVDWLRRKGLLKTEEF